MQRQQGMLRQNRPAAHFAHRHRRTRGMLDEASSELPAQTRTGHRQLPHRECTRGAPFEELQVCWTSWVTLCLQPRNFLDTFMPRARFFLSRTGHVWRRDGNIYTLCRQFCFVPALVCLCCRRGTCGPGFVRCCDANPSLLVVPLVSEP